jgi:PhzF family phenazine biosynthesis protein
MPLPLFQVDAFTDRPFAGNPAAVCLCSDEFPGSLPLQEIAAEMNLSETAFVAPRSEGENAHFDLRWFTPAQEVDLCGHATLAAAHVLWAEGHAPAAAAITFHTRSGPLTARRPSPGGDAVRLDFPAEPVESCDAPPALTEALGAAPAFTGRNRMDVLACFDDAQAVRRLTPDFAHLAEAIDARGVIATAREAAGAGPDFVSRFFAPRAGVNEDPVTGSAHCALAPFWAERLGRARLTGRQASARGGTVRCEARGERVGLGGPAVTVLRGALAV